MTAADAQDVVFFDAQEALACARLGRRVAGPGNVDGGQLCYYTAEEALPEALDNLVQLHPQRMLATLVETRLRLPTAVVMPDWLPQDMRAAYIRLVNTIVEEALRQRRERVAGLFARIAQMPAPESRTGRPLRILAFASRHSTVIQHASRGLIESFAALGHDARLVIEANDREHLDVTHLQQAVIEAAPDILILIDVHQPEFCPPGTIQVVWWQDPMPPLAQGAPLPWRDEDLVYILDGYFRAGVISTGLAPERVRTQQFCIDEGIFHPPVTEAGRRRAVVFVGTSYGALMHHDDPGERELIRQLDALVDAGEPLSTERVGELAAACNVDAPRAVCRVMMYCTRDRFVRMLCQQQAIPVEVYGYGWENDPLVVPFFRGPVAHGAALADLYRSVSHALITHAFLINHQRLGEVGACGCIPLIWDCRAVAEAPHWDAEALYFSDQSSLYAALARTVPTHPERFRDHFSYRHFAQRILADACSDGLLPQDHA